MTDQRQQVERLLDVAVYAPVGLALTVRDHLAEQLAGPLPKRLRQQRQAVQNRVQLARFIGELAVRHGRAELAKQLEVRRLADAAAAATAAEAAAAVAIVAPTVRPDTPEPTPMHVTTHDDGPSAASLPIGDYESLAAIHVVERLSSLRVDEIEQIRRFETTHRARRTVLAKIDQLQDGAR